MIRYNPSFIQRGVYSQRQLKAFFFIPKEYFLNQPSSVNETIWDRVDKRKTQKNLEEKTKEQIQVELEEQRRTDFQLKTGGIIDEAIEDNNSRIHYHSFVNGGICGYIRSPEVDLDKEKIIGMCAIRGRKCKSEGQYFPDCKHYHRLMRRGHPVETLSHAVELYRAKNQ